MVGLVNDAIIGIDRLQLRSASVLADRFTVHHHLNVGHLCDRERATENKGDRVIGQAYWTVYRCR